MHLDKKNIHTCENLIANTVSIPQYFKTFIDSKVDLESNPNVLCPLHSEDTPSWRYSAKLETWRCFGQCDTGGGVVKLHQLYHNKTKGTNLNYYQALDSFRYMFPVLKKMPSIYQKSKSLKELDPFRNVSFELREPVRRLNSRHLYTDILHSLSLIKDTSIYGEVVTELFQILSYGDNMREDKRLRALSQLRDRYFRGKGLGDEVKT